MEPLDMRKMAIRVRKCCFITCFVLMWIYFRIARCFLFILEKAYAKYPILIPEFKSYGIGVINVEGQYVLIRIQKYTPKPGLSRSGYKYILFLLKHNYPYTKIRKYIMENTTDGIVIFLITAGKKYTILTINANTDSVNFDKHSNQTTYPIVFDKIPLAEPLPENINLDDLERLVN